MDTRLFDTVCLSQQYVYHEAPEIRRRRDGWVQKILTQPQISRIMAVIGFYGVRPFHGIYGEMADAGYYTK